MKKLFILFFFISASIYSRPLEDRPGSPQNNHHAQTNQPSIFYQLLNRHQQQLRNQDRCMWCCGLSLFVIGWVINKHLQHDHQN